MTRPPNFRDYEPSKDLLQDRVILVTGAGTGIGKAAAIEFARHGATVLLLGRTISKLETVYDEIVTAGFAQPSIAPMNLAKAHGPDYSHLVEQIDNEHGRLDGLLHNAGILGKLAPIEHHDVGLWTEVMHVNLTAPFVMTKMLLPSLKKSADASVVFTSSGVGRQGRAYWGAYAVSKFGTEGLAQVLADETEAGGTLRVNCINPGRTRTSMRAAAYPGEDPSTLATPDEIMDAYLYLMGPDSQGITGETFDAQA